MGIPAGGLFTGAEGTKTEEQAALFGGTAGEAYDECYHQACDTSRNISNEALEQNADAIAYALGTFANSTRSINDRAKVAALAAALEPRGAVTTQGAATSTGDTDSVPVDITAPGVPSPIRNAGTPP